MAASKKLVWLDCDPGHDDAIAILMALYEPTLELLGVSTVHGNAGLQFTAANAGRCLHAFGAPEGVKVYPGAPKPLIGPPHPAVDIHGNDGLGGVQGLPEPNDPFVQARIVTPDQYDNEMDRDALPAVVGIRNAALKCLETGTTMYLGVTGACTNAAIFILAYPNLAKKAIKQIVCMGGGVGLGNITPAAEFNIYIDPEACQIVYDSGIPVFGIPLNTTHKTLFHTDAHRHLLDPFSPPTSSSTPLPPAVTPLRYTLSTLLTFFTETYETVFGFHQGPPIHDCLVISYITDPTIFHDSQLLRVDVDRNEGISKGAMVVDVYKKAPIETRNVEVSENLDIPKVWRSFFSAVAQADARSPLNTSVKIADQIPEPPELAIRAVV